MQEIPPPASYKSFKSSISFRLLRNYGIIWTEDTTAVPVFMLSFFLVKNLEYCVNFQLVKYIICTLTNQNNLTQGKSESLFQYIFEYLQMIHCRGQFL